MLYSILQQIIQNTEKHPNKREVSQKSVKTLARRQLILYQLKLKLLSGFKWILFINVNTCCNISDLLYQHEVGFASSKYDSVTFIWKAILKFFSYGRLSSKIISIFCTTSNIMSVRKCSNWNLFIFCCSKYGHRRMTL